MFANILGIFSLILNAIMITIAAFDKEDNGGNLIKISIFCLPTIIYIILMLIK